MEGLTELEKKAFWGQALRLGAKMFTGAGTAAKTVGNVSGTLGRGAFKVGKFMNGGPQSFKSAAFWTTVPTAATAMIAGGAKQGTVNAARFGDDTMRMAQGVRRAPGLTNISNNGYNNTIRNF
jgi:hypothetical protein